MKKSLALLALLLCMSWAALADTPLPPPTRETTCSPAGKFCAASDPAQNITLVSPRHSQETLWSIPSWHRWIFVSDDGESFAAGYSGMNLVPVYVTLSEPVLFFYNRGKLVRTVRLGELYRSKSQLRRTISHYAWAHIPGFNKANQLIVELVNGKRLAFAAKTGQVQPVIPDAPNNSLKPKPLRGPG